MLSFALLVVFIFCGLVYSRASKELMRLDKIRLEKEPPPNPDSTLGSATEFARRMGISLAPGGEELKDFCDRNGYGAEYARANRLLFGAIILALACIYAIVKFGPAKT